MLQGKLVRLRAIEETDLENLHWWINDAEVTFFLGFHPPVSLVQERGYISRWATAETELVLMIEKLDGTAIGSLGLEWSGRYPGARDATLGIMIGDKSCWSQGYGTDAIMTLLCYAFEEMNFHRVDLVVMQFNQRGIRCYEKCGFQVTGRDRERVYRKGRYWDLVRMDILRPEYDDLACSYWAEDVLT